MTTGQRLVFLAKTGGVAKTLLLLIGAGATTGAALVDYSKVPSATALQHLLTEVVTQGRVRVRLGVLEPAQLSARTVSMLFAQQPCDIDARNTEDRISVVEWVRVSGYAPVLLGSELESSHLSARQAVILSADFFDAKISADSQERIAADTIGELT